MSVTLKYSHLCLGIFANLFGKLHLNLPPTYKHPPLFMFTPLQQDKLDAKIV